MAEDPRRRSPQPRQPSPLIFETAEEYNRALGLLVEQCRLARGFEQTELGRAVGTTGATISRMEGGERPFTVFLLRKIGHRLAVSPERLMNLGQAMPKPPRNPHTSRQAMRQALRLISLPKTKRRFFDRLLDLLEDQAILEHVVAVLNRTYTIADGLSASEIKRRILAERREHFAPRLPAWAEEFQTEGRR